VASGAAGVLPVSLNCPLPLRRTHPPTLVCSFRVFTALGVTSTKSGRLKVNLSLSEKRGGKSHLGTILLLAVTGIWRLHMVIRAQEVPWVNQITYCSVQCCITEHL
jgi:hypothetical protein